MISTIKSAFGNIHAPGTEKSFRRDSQIQSFLFVEWLDVGNIQARIIGTGTVNSTFSQEPPCAITTFSSYGPYGEVERNTVCQPVFTPPAVEKI